MADPTESRALFQRIIDHLKREEGAAVLALAPDALEASKDNPALRARVLAWLGQAEMFVGNFKGATQAVRQAIQMAQAQEDNQAVLQLRSLLAQITMRRQAALPAVPPTELMDTPLFRADAAISRGAYEEGEALARAVVEAGKASGDPRDQVLALLAIARIPGKAEQAIAEAAQVADASSDMNLVSAVARAAKSVGLEIPAKVF